MCEVNRINHYWALTSGPSLAYCCEVFPRADQVPTKSSTFTKVFNFLASSPCLADHLSVGLPACDKFASTIAANTPESAIHPAVQEFVDWCNRPWKSTEEIQRNVQKVIEDVNKETLRHTKLGLFLHSSSGEPLQDQLDALAAAQSVLTPEDATQGQDAEEERPAKRLESSVILAQRDDAAAEDTSMADQDQIQSCVDGGCCDNDGGDEDFVDDTLFASDNEEVDTGMRDEL